MAKVVSNKASKNNGAAGKPSDAEINEQIGQLAYQYFVDRGCEHGHDVEDWIRAEAVIKKRKS